MKTILAALNPYGWLIKIACAALAVAGIWYGIHQHNQAQQAIGYDRAVGEYQVKKAAADQAALVKERMLRKKVEDAENAATERETKLRADYAAAHAAARGLRDTITDLRGRLATSPVAACRATAATTLDVFEDCTGKYRALAEAADGHASDVETMIQAWPK